MLMQNNDSEINFLYLQPKRCNSMNQTVLLVNEWASFEEQHPDAQLEDFCRYYLTRQREAQKAEPLFADQHNPPLAHLVLGKLMGHLVKLYSFYVSLAIKDIDIRRE